MLDIRSRLRLPWVQAIRFVPGDVEMNRVNRALKWVLNMPPKDKNGGQPSALALSIVRLAVRMTNHPQGPRAAAQELRGRL